MRVNATVCEPTPSPTATGTGGGELPNNGAGTSSSSNSSSNDERWWLWWLLGFLAAVVLLGLVVALVRARKEWRHKAALSGAVLSPTRDTYQNNTYEELRVAATNGSSAPPMHQVVKPLAAGSSGGASLHGSTAGDDAVVFNIGAVGAYNNPVYDNSAEDKHPPPLPRRSRESEMQWRGVTLSPERSGSPSRETTT
jgi:hypothetical protein